MSLPRRTLLQALLAGAVAAPARGHTLLGPLTPPLPAPPLTLTLHDGRSAPLRQLLGGRLTALQLMFTGCSATCPIQGAVFAALQPLVQDTVPGAQLLSVSIDPLADDAAALSAWRRRFGARDGWLAAVPPVRLADALLDFVGGRSAGSDRHSAQVYLFDPQGRLAFRCAEFASARDVALAMATLARQR